MTSIAARIDDRRGILAIAAHHHASVAVQAVARVGASVPAEGVIAVVIRPIGVTFHAPTHRAPPVRAMDLAEREPLLGAAVDVIFAAPTLRVGHARPPIRLRGAPRVLPLAHHCPVQQLSGRCGVTCRGPGCQGSHHGALALLLLEQRGSGACAVTGGARLLDVALGLRHAGPICRQLLQELCAGLGVFWLQDTAQRLGVRADQVAHPSARMRRLQGEKGHGIRAEPRAGADAGRGQVLDHVTDRIRRASGEIDARTDQHPGCAHASQLQSLQGARLTLGVPGAFVVSL
mmetsp:Transcript_115603/g.299733  ORF Transcript_115603/g.299733 Transcript_115603/m.299733 type:complete len:289 (+) Transcript_115603:974-1840(+)